MISRLVTSKPCGYLSYSTIRRHKVRNLPKEYYRDDENEYFSRPKPGRSFLTSFFGFMNRENWTFKDVMHWMKWKSIRNIQEDQQYLHERHQTLGSDLATTHFITFRGGKVKFAGNDKWYTDNDILEMKLPSKFLPGFYVQEIDASKTYLCYEGFENLCNLRALKKLVLRNCEFVDDWCLLRTHLFKNSIEFLDISGCHNVTERGICTLHELKNLKTLVIEDTPNIKDKELVCLLLQDFIPKCNIIGVDYDDPILLKRLGSYMN